MIVFISGGCKNGKTKLGLDIALKLSKDNKYYFATMLPFDDEDRERIENHKKERLNMGFNTIEKGINISDVSIDSSSTVLLDSLTALLLNETFEAEKNGADINLVSYKIINDLDSLINKTKNIIIISDYIYSDGVVYNEYTESFKKNLANIDRWVASISDVVIERVVGINHFVKGSLEI